jgi:hypothetical protein
MGRILFAVLLVLGLAASGCTDYKTPKEQSKPPEKSKPGGPP